MKSIAKKADDDAVRMKTQFHSLDEVQWDYNDMNEWQKEKNEVKNLIIKGNSQKIKHNRKRFALFYAKTLDRIADPEYHDKSVPQELFEIAALLTSKIPKSSKFDLTN